MKRRWQQITHWELWPFYIIYMPLSVVWLFYAVRAGAFWFFSNVDPTLEFSGFEGESKKEMYDLLPPHLYPATVYVTPASLLPQIYKQIAASGIGYPFAVKPQVGMQGMMFRKINNAQELAAYHRQMPADYIVQSLAEMPLEFSVFHVRYPGEKRGKITGLILKEYLAVTGDGKHTLLQLIQKNSRAKFREEEMKYRHAAQLTTVVAAGEKYYLSMAGNHNRGARFINLHNEIDEALCDVFDAISNEENCFYYGRYDLKCTSLKDLKKGENIQILEYNGTGAEPNHIYDCGMRYTKALRVIISHWEDMYQIGRINFKKGIQYWSFQKGRKHLQKAHDFFKILDKADRNCTL